MVQKRVQRQIYNQYKKNNNEPKKLKLKFWDYNVLLMIKKIKNLISLANCIERLVNSIKFIIR